MIPHKALIKHDPTNGKWSDCFRASVAAIFDIEDMSSVPHFLDKGVSGDAGLAAFRDWLHARNMCPVYLILDGELTLSEALEIAGNATDSPYIVVGATIDGGHCVIGKGANVWHDVAWIKTPLVKGSGPDNEWLIVFIGVRLNCEITP